MRDGIDGLGVKASTTAAPILFVPNSVYTQVRMSTHLGHFDKSDFQIGKVLVQDSLGEAAMIDELR